MLLDDIRTFHTDDSVFTFEDLKLLRKELEAEIKNLKALFCDFISSRRELNSSANDLRAFKYLIHISEILSLAPNVLEFSGIQFSDIPSNILESEKKVQRFENMISQGEFEILETSPKNY